MSSSTPLPANFSFINLLPKYSFEIEIIITLARGLNFSSFYAISVLQIKMKMQTRKVMIDSNDGIYIYRYNKLQ